MTLRRATNPRTCGYHPKNWTLDSDTLAVPFFNLVCGILGLFGAFMPWRLSYRTLFPGAFAASSLSLDLELRVHGVCPLLARHRLAIWRVAVSRPWCAPYFLSLHSTGYNFFLDRLMSHQTLTARHNQSPRRLDKPSECSRLKEEPTICQFVLAWREGSPEIPRELRGVKGLGRVIGVCSPPLLDTLADLNKCRSTSLWSWPSTPLHGVHLPWTAVRSACVSHGATGS